MSRFYAPAILSRVSQVVGGGGDDDDGGMPEEKSFEHKIMGQIYVGRKANSSSSWPLVISYYTTFPIQFTNLIPILSDWKYFNDGKDQKEFILSKTVQ